MINFNFRFLKKKISNFPTPIQYEIIEQEQVNETQIPIHLNDDLEKVKAVPFNISLKDELNEFWSREYRSGPFYNYKILDLLVLKNRLYFDRFEYSLNPNEKPLRLYESKDIVEYDHAAFSSMRISTVFFGHWLREELMLIDYLQSGKNIISSSPSTAQKKDIAELFSLKYDVKPFARIKNADMYMGWQHGGIYRAILEKYKNKIQSFSQIRVGEKLKVIYLKRGGTASKRELYNEDALIELLNRYYDVSVYVAETTAVKKLYSSIYDADVILSIEGSQLAHGIIAGRKGAILACIQPPYRFYNPFKNYCADAGMKYAVFVAEQSSDKNSFFVDLNRVQLFMERLEREL